MRPLVLSFPPLPSCHFQRSVALPPVIPVGAVREPPFLLPSCHSQRSVALPPIIPVGAVPEPPFLLPSCHSQRSAAPPTCHSERSEAKSKNLVANSRIPSSSAPPDILPLRIIPLPCYHPPMEDPFPAPDLAPTPSVIPPNQAFVSPTFFKRKHPQFNQSQAQNQSNPPLFDYQIESTPGTNPRKRIRQTNEAPRRVIPSALHISFPAQRSAPTRHSRRGGSGTALPPSPQ